MSVESVKAAYVRGEIDVDEFERQVERALTTTTARPPQWLVNEFQRAHNAAHASGRSAVLAGGASWTDAPGGFDVYVDPHLPDDQRAAVLEAEFRDVDRCGLVAGLPPR